MAVTSESPIRVLKGGAYKALGVCSFTTLALCGIAGLSSAVRVHSAFAIVLSAVVTSACLTIAFRWSRARIDLRTTSLRARTLFRTVNLPWTQVDHATLVATNGFRLIVIIRLHTNDQKAIRLDGVGRRRTREDFDQTDMGQALNLINLCAAQSRLVQPPPKG